MTRRRAEFPTYVKREAYERSKDSVGVARCESHLVPQLAGIGCRRELRSGDVRYEHIIQDAIGGRPTLDNCAVLCSTCWRLKTDKFDLPVIAKVKRVADRDRGIRPTPRQRLPGGRGDLFKIKVDGRVVDRRTGEPWRPGR